MKKSILTLFGFNAALLPDATFIEKEMLVNSHGDLYKDYSKPFRDKRFAIFDTIEVRDFGPCKNVTFLSNRFDKMNLFGFRKLMNRLSKILGPDFMNLGRYGLTDFKDIRDKDLDFYSLRHWSDLHSEVDSVDISFDRKNNSISLVLFGIKKLEMEPK